MEFFFLFIETEFIYRWWGEFSSRHSISAGSHTYLHPWLVFFANTWVLYKMKNLKAGASTWDIWYELTIFSKQKRSSPIKALYEGGMRISPLVCHLVASWGSFPQKRYVGHFLREMQIYLEWKWKIYFAREISKEWFYSVSVEYWLRPENYLYFIGFKGKNRVAKITNIPSKTSPPINNQPTVLNSFNPKVSIFYCMSPGNFICPDFPQGIFGSVKYFFRDGPASIFFFFVLSFFSRDAYYIFWFEKA